MAAVADDSGLCVDALNGMPGVLSARWAGPWAVSPSGGKLPDADAANLRLVLAQLADVPDARLGAAFVCAAALVTPESLTAGGCRAAWGGSRARDARAENRAPGASAASGGSGASDAADAPDALPAWGGVGAGETVAEARMPGRLVRAPRGANGFGYDPIFVPDGHARTNAELSAAEKDAISHRGQALRALAPAIQDALRRT
ncbi:MAG: hypothetical protein FWD74_08570 [Actinomycetia bacterium]|nr:hypothetical protein [Actinomycetes bacterium]